MEECLAAIHLCRVRVTRLNSDGSPAAGPNNSYVSDKPIQLGVTPTYEAGKDSTIVGGCDCIVATYRGDDKLKRFEFELDLATLEWELFEMLTGATAIADGSDVIGNWFNDNAFNCSNPAQPLVAFEGWQTGWNEDHQDATWPYIHWLWPATKWSVSSMTLENDFNQPKLSGFSRRNTVWGLGIYHDQPEAAQPLGGGWASASIPAAQCGYLTHSIT